MMIPWRLSCSHEALLVFLLDLLFSSPGRDKERASNNLRKTRKASDKPGR